MRSKIEERAAFALDTIYVKGGQKRPGFIAGGSGRFLSCALGSGAVHGIASNLDWGCPGPVVKDELV
jgi:hypothetical protein